MTRRLYDELLRLWNESLQEQNGLAFGARVNPGVRRSRLNLEFSDGG